MSGSSEGQASPSRSVADAAAEAQGQVGIRFRSLHQIPESAPAGLIVAEGRRGRRPVAQASNASWDPMAGWGQCSCRSHFIAPARTWVRHRSASNRMAGAETLIGGLQPGAEVDERAFALGSTPDGSTGRAAPSRAPVPRPGRSLQQGGPALTDEAQYAGSLTALFNPSPRACWFPALSQGRPAPSPRPASPAEVARARLPRRVPAAAIRASAAGTGEVEQRFRTGRDCAPPRRPALRRAPGTTNGAKGARPGSAGGRAVGGDRPSGRAGEQGTAAPGRKRAGQGAGASSRAGPTMMAAVIGGEAVIRGIPEGRSITACRAA